MGDDIPKKKLGKKKQRNDVRDKRAIRKKQQKTEPEKKKSYTNEETYAHR